MSESISRRDAIRLSTAVASASAALLVNAAPDPVRYGIAGAGEWGSLLLRHLAKLTEGRCVAICDTSQDALNGATALTASSPKGFRDYKLFLADKDLEAVIIATPIAQHFPMIRDALAAGKHVFCENCVAFRPEEIHFLRALAPKYPKLVFQAGLQTRYSQYFYFVKQMIESGALGYVTHIHAQWHRNPGWIMEPGGAGNPKNWRLYRATSVGLAAELASHQVDAANWFFGSRPHFVIGAGGLDTRKDGRDVDDNIQLIFTYPNGRKLTQSTISTNRHAPILSSRVFESGFVIMGTAGTVELTLGDETSPPTALWFREADSGHGGQRGVPILSPATQADSNDSFLSGEAKAARLWLYKKGLMIPGEDRNPIDSELASFLSDVRSGAQPRAHLETGLHAATAAILSNVALRENRRVAFNEMESMGVEPAAPPPQPVAVPPQ